jgi:hypothetical protein
MEAYVPPGWPAGVHPPGSEEFEQTAVTWLLDVVPPDYRLHGVLRRHPLALAVLARHHLAACVQGARDGYRAARTELAALPPGGVDAVLEVYRGEGRRLVETARAVDLVGRALRGEVFTPQLGHQRRSASPRSPARATAPLRQEAPLDAARDRAAREPAAREAAPHGGPERQPAAREAARQSTAPRKGKAAQAAARERAVAKGIGPESAAEPRGGGAAEKARGTGRRAAKSGSAR